MDENSVVRRFTTVLNISSNSKQTGENANNFTVYFHEHLPTSIGDIYDVQLKQIFIGNSNNDNAYSTIQYDGDTYHTEDTDIVLNGKMYSVRVSMNALSAQGYSTEFGKLPFLEWYIGNKAYGQNKYLAGCYSDNNDMARFTVNKINLNRIGIQIYEYSGTQGTTEQLAVLGDGTTAIPFCALTLEVGYYKRMTENGLVPA